MRKSTVILWLALLFGGIVALFWHIDWVYNLPTPVPQHYKAVQPGHEIPQAAQWASYPGAMHGKPLFLHFFNPDCPCSRFNVTHFKTLVSQYGAKANFEIVVVSHQTYSVKDIQDRFATNIPVLFDTSIATLCGVYSTPQAVIIDNQNRLYYRGNYNKSRYCTDNRSEFARMALDSLLENRQHVAFDPHAVKAYGCSLPFCTESDNQ